MWYLSADCPAVYVRFLYNKSMEIGWHVEVKSEHKASRFETQGTSFSQVITQQKVKWKVIICKNIRAFRIESLFIANVIRLYSVSQPPPWNSDIFSQTVGNFSPHFTRLLYVPIYARLQIFIQLPATLMKLCHIKRDHHNVLKMSIVDRNTRWVVGLNMALLRHNWR